MSDPAPPTDTAPRRPSFWLLAALTVTGVVAIHVYTPVLPAVAADLRATDAQVQLSIMVFMLSFALSQLILGPLSDRFGRRPLVIAGLILYVGANVLCALAPTIEWLIAARAVQALGASTGGVLGRAIVRDVWDRGEMASLMGKLQIAQVLGAASAPIIGSFIAAWFDWTAGFWFLSLFAGVQLVLAFRLLPETNRYRGTRTGFFSMMKDFGTLLRSPGYLGNCLSTGFLNAMYFTFFSAAPFLLIDRLGLSPDRFGFIMMVAIGGSLTGAWISSRYAARPRARLMMPLGVLVALSGAMIILYVGLFGETTVSSVVAPLALLGLGNGLLSPLAAAGAVSVQPRIAGTASAGFGFVLLMLGAAGALAATQMSHDTPVDMALGMVGFCLLALLSLVLLRLEPRTETSS